MLPIELKLISSQNCFVQLPNVFIDNTPTLKLGSLISIRSLHNDIEIRATWSGQTTNANFAALDYHFAKANNFDDELVVIELNQSHDTADCTLCMVELIDPNDLQVINQHQDVNLLDTCQVIYKNLVIPIWISKHVNVLARVQYFEPIRANGLLNKWTELQFQNKPLTRVNDETQDELINNPQPIVSYSLGLISKPHIATGALLVTGERGSGKTHFLKQTLKDYSKFNCKLYNCRQLQGKRPENVRKVLDELANSAYEKQPSILALDDIDAILSNDTRVESEKGPDVIYKMRLVDIFVQFVKNFERVNHPNGNDVAILCSSRSLDKLEERISKPDGRCLFNKQVKLDYPTLEQRATIIETILSEHKQIRHQLTKSELIDLSRRCNSFMPADLKLIVERSVINACSRSLSEFSSEPLTIRLDDIIDSLGGYPPAHLRSINLKPKSTASLDQVGGMADIKEALMRIILLPMKYPLLYSKCPKRPKTSILLYGPPGCGKTLLAEALTNHEGLNSICVRGPELLSKYIGASEAAVRDLFKRAESAAPCIVFFDEFESLVSKRGADSIGVTDRIVNQFLTLMDGVEALKEGVYLIAASSRPDMIDPAVLRPGRLDNHLYCPMPTEEGHLEILDILSRDISIEDRENTLGVMSKKLSGFTGADVKALLYAAQLRVIHSVMGPAKLKSKRDSNEAGDRSDLNITVTLADLEESLSEMQDDVRNRNADFQVKYPIDFRRAVGPVAVKATLA